MSTVLWFTGLSGSGKTTIALELRKKLESLKKNVEILDGDVVRDTTHKDLGFTRDDILENNRRIAILANSRKSFVDFVLVPIISPFIEGRENARKLISDNFFELFINCPIEYCIQRDVKGLYKKALSGDIDNFIGISRSVPYEEPENPDIELDTHANNVIDCTEQIIEYLERHAII